MATDRTDWHLRQLQPDLAYRARVLVALFRYFGVPLKITSSRRSIAEQRRLVAQGRSKTLNSRHLHGRAFDVDIDGWHRDAIPTAFWPILGEVGEELGLRWGGRWKAPYDPGHFEL